MATINGGTITVSRGRVHLDPDGNCVIIVNYSNPAGVIFHSRTLTVLADGSQVRDEYGTIIAAPVPAGLASAISSFASALDTSIANGAAAGKLNL